MVVGAALETPVGEGAGAEPPNVVAVPLKVITTSPPAIVGNGPKELES
jgi:hypothetical protein